MLGSIWGGRGAPACAAAAAAAAAVERARMRSRKGTQSILPAMSCPRGGITKGADISLVHVRPPYFGRPTAPSFGRDQAEDLFSYMALSSIMPSMAVEGIKAIYKNGRQKQVVPRLLLQKETAGSGVGPCSPSCWENTLCFFTFNDVFETVFVVNLHTKTARGAAPLIPAICMPAVEMQPDVGNMHSRWHLGG